MPVSKAIEEPLIPIRDIEQISEIREIEELQREVWGCDDHDVAPCRRPPDIYRTEKRFRARGTFIRMAEAGLWTAENPDSDLCPDRDDSFDVSRVFGVPVFIAFPIFAVMLPESFLELAVETRDADTGGSYRKTLAFGIHPDAAVYAGFHNPVSHARNDLQAKAGSLIYGCANEFVSLHSVHLRGKRPIRTQFHSKIS